MKKTIVSIILLIAVTFLFAQQTIKVESAAKKQTNEENAKMKTDVLDKTLSLTPEQKAKVYTICLDFFNAREQFMTLKESNNEEFLAKVKSIQAKSESTLNALLTSEQKKKLEDYSKAQK